MALGFAEYFMSNHLNTDLRLYYCGRENCQPSHSYGPAMRDHYLLHYIVGGSGIFRTDDHQFSLNKGDSFCIAPNRPASYRADEQDPWVYYWIGFSGKPVADLLPDTSFVVQSSVHAPEESEQLNGKFESLMLKVSEVDDAASEAHIYGLLWQLLSMYSHNSESYRLSSSKEPSGHSKAAYVKAAVAFIKENYHRPLTVSLIARYVGLERSYFTKLFSSHVGISPYEFLQRFRLEKAALLLNGTLLPVQTIANSIGFEDVSHFGKSFTRHFGIPPTSYRRNMALNQTKS
ncbi:hypothetical protein B1748_04875 [Paenibacillus sp. MY03]|nr:hypothetical protein B1748_04875 [Paenibacillus sp. MY03]